MDAVRASSAITLVLGGARSGKSEVAERLAAVWRVPVTYLATGPSADPPGSEPSGSELAGSELAGSELAGSTPTGDAAWARRVALHRARRPADWETVEIPSGGDLADAVRRIPGALLVDSLGTWVAALSGFGADGTAAAELVQALGERRGSGGPVVMVSDEVGLGVHPSTEVGGRFRDALGQLNRQVAAVADRVLLVVAGRVLTLDQPEDLGT